MHSGLLSAVHVHCRESEDVSNQCNLRLVVIVRIEKGNVKNELYKNRVVVFGIILFSRILRVYVHRRNYDTGNNSDDEFGYY